MRKILVSAFLGLLLSQISLAQVDYYETEKESPPKWELPRLSFKFLPSHYLSQFPTLLFEVETRINRESSMVFRGGPVIENGNLSDYKAPYFQNRSGFKSSVAYKVVLPLKKQVRPFVAIELFYNDISFDRTRTFELSCGPGCQFYQEATFDVFFTEFGLRLNGGVNIPISEVFFLEISAALGIKDQQIDSGSQRPQNLISELGEPYDDQLSTTTIAGDFAIKLGFVILR